MSNYKFKVTNGVVVTTLSQISSDTDIYKIFGDALRANRNDEHPYKTGVALKLGLVIDCAVLPKVVQAIDTAIYKNKISLYIVRNKKARLAKIEHLYQMIQNKVITLDIRNKARTKYNIVVARKCLRTLTTIDERVYTKEASAYNGDFMAVCNKSEATDIKEREYTIVYHHGNVLNVVGDTSKLTRKQLDRYRAMNPIVIFNMTQDDVSVVKESVKAVYMSKEEDSTYQLAFRQLFSLNGLDITNEVVQFMTDTLISNCTTYVEQGSLEAYEFIKNIINIHIKYEEYLDIQNILHLPSIVDFVVGEFIHDRDIEVESFYEDRKDDEYEEINNKYLED